MRRHRRFSLPPYQRLLWFDGQVREGRYPKIADLCERYEITERTACRDIAFLKYNLGAPLEYDRRKRGYYYTDPSFSLPAVTLTEGELVAIFLAEEALRRYAGAPYEAELRSAFQKLCRALTEEVTVDLDSFAEAITFEVGPTRQVEVETFRQAQQAVQKREQLRLRYYAASRNEEGTRIVDPYHLHNHTGDWYLIAYDQGRHGYRDFALSRIRHLEPTGRRFTLRPDFDRRAYLANQFGGFRGEQAVEVVVRFDPYQARWMREKTWPGETGREEHPDGSLTLRLTVTSLEGVLRWVLQYGSHVAVLGPEELRRAVVEEAQKIANMYERRK